MVILQENHIKQPDAVVHTAADTHGFFLQVAQSGRGLAGVEHMATGVGYEALVAVGGRSDARHTLHDIEHGALDLQQAQFFAGDAERYIAGFDGVAVMQQLVHTAFGVEVPDDFLRHLNAGEYAGVFDE